MIYDPHIHPQSNFDASSYQRAKGAHNFADICVKFPPLFLSRANQPIISYSVDNQIKTILIFFVFIIINSNLYMFLK